MTTPSTCLRSPHARSELIDAVKGILMLLVILGHITPCPEKWKAVRGWIYFFHMPLFFGVCGWLTNVSNLEKESWATLGSRLLKRMGIPWMAAMIVFIAIFVMGNNISLQCCPSTIVKLLIKPWYHLWFIPALMSMIVATKFLFAKRISMDFLFALSLACSCLWVFPNVDNNYGDGFLRPLGDKRILSMAPFFVLGMVLRSRFATGKDGGLIRYSITWTAFSLLILTAVNAGFGETTTMFRDASWVALNLFLIAAVCGVFQKYDGYIKGNPLSWLGKNSLPIYLWHLLPILLARSIVNPAENLPGFWLLAGILLATFLGGLRLLEILLLINQEVICRGIVFGVWPRTRPILPTVQATNNHTQANFSIE